jgi:hypothetical protein
MPLSEKPARLVLESFVSDGRYALRQLRKNPGFTLIAILPLALGIGAATAIFSVVYGVLLRRLPYPDPDRIVAVFEINTKGAVAAGGSNFDDFRDQSRSFEPSPVQRLRRVGRGASGRRARRVSPAFLRVLGVSRRSAATSTPRTLDRAPFRRSWSATTTGGSSSDRRGPRPAAAQDRRRVFSVIGVLPASFRFPAEVDLWLAADLDGENPSRTSHNTPRSGGCATV